MKILCIILLFMVGCTTVKHYHYYAVEETEEIGLWEAFDELAEQDDEDEDN